MRTLLLATTFAIAIATAANATTTQTDSVAYPTVQRVSEHEDIQRKIQTLKFNDARTAIETKIKQAKRKRESVDVLEEMLTKCTYGMNALSGTDRVLIVDSVVMDKAELLNAYGMTDDMGTLTMSANGETVSYKAQLNGMELTPQTVTTEDDKQKLAIVRRYNDDEMDRPQQVDGLGVDGDVNYPFLLSDGQRFYFAARSEEGFGNYDLYATRYDNDSKRFYRAENMGFPYNSYANDYMLVIDDVNGLGWFASDRYQPEGKVCVYTFIPNESRHTYSDDELTDEQRINVASLRSLAALQTLYTDEDRAAIANAKAAIEAQTLQAKQQQGHDFEFVINNTKTYYSINDFRSPKARQLCKQWQQLLKNIDILREQLAEMRNNPQRNAQKIINHERRLLELKNETNTLAKNIRREELER